MSLCDDSFTGADGSSPNTSKWTITGSPTIQNNTVELEYTDALLCNVPFSGDFDISIDFELQPPISGVGWGAAELNAIIDSTHYMFIEAAVTAGAKRFMCAYNDGSGYTTVNVSRTNNDGGLRLVRSGNTFTAYAKDGGGAFTSVHSNTIGSVGETVSIVVDCEANNNLVVRFDNFTVSSGCGLTTVVPTTMLTTIVPTTTLTTPAPTTLAPTTAPPNACEDYFTGVDGSSIDSTKWTITGSPTIQSNSAELDRGESLLSKLTFPGDFDVSINFALQAPIPTTGWGAAELKAVFSTSFYMYIEAPVISGTKYFICAYNNGGGINSVNISRTYDFGSLRLVRSGNTITAYVRDGAGGFTAVHSNTIGTPGNTFSIWIECATSSSSIPLTIRFDAFRVLTGCGYTTIIPTTLTPTTTLTTPTPTTAGPTTAPPTWAPFTIHPTNDKTFNAFSNNYAGVLSIYTEINGYILNPTHVVGDSDLVVDTEITFRLPGYELVEYEMSVETTISGVAVANSNRMNWVGWSKIGDVSFELDLVNDAGFRPMEWMGYVYQVMRLDKNVVIYGSTGITMAFPVPDPAPTFGFKEVANFGIKNKTAVCGDEFVHYFIDNLGALYRLTSNGLEYLGYEEFLYPLVNPTIMYDAIENRLYISDSTTGYIYNDTALTGGYAGLTGIIRLVHWKTGIGPAEIAIQPISLCTDVIDFKSRGLKTIESIQFGVTSEKFLYAAIDYRYSTDKVFKTSRWTKLNNEGIANLRVAGVEFRIRLKALEYGEFELSYINLQFKPFDKRFARGPIGMQEQELG